jgi:hypothetical protein
LGAHGKDLPVTAQEPIMTSARRLSRRPRSLQQMALGLAGVVLTFGLSVSAQAAADLGHQPARVASHWGAGPLTLSLIASARREAPLRGADPALAGGHQQMPLRAVAVGYHPTSIPMPVAYRPAEGM